MAAIDNLLWHDLAKMINSTTKVCYVIRVYVIVCEESFYECVFNKLFMGNKNEFCGMKVNRR